MYKLIFDNIFIFLNINMIYVDHFKEYYIR